MKGVLLPLTKNRDHKTKFLRQVGMNRNYRQILTQSEYVTYVGGDELLLIPKIFRSVITDKHLIDYRLIMVIVVIPGDTTFFQVSPTLKPDFRILTNMWC